MKLYEGSKDKTPKICIIKITQMCNKHIKTHARGKVELQKVVLLFNLTIFAQSKAKSFLQDCAQNHLFARWQVWLLAKSSLVKCTTSELSLH